MAGIAFADVPAPAVERVVEGDKFLVARADAAGDFDVYSLRVAPGGLYLPAAAAIAVPANRPRLVARVGGEWREESVADSGRLFFAEGLVNFCGLLFAAATEGEVVPAYFRGEFEVGFWVLDANDRWEANSAAVTVGTAVWLCSGAVSADSGDDDYRLVASAAAPALEGSSFFRVRVGYVSEVVDSDDNEYRFVFDLAGATGWASG